MGSSNINLTQSREAFIKFVNLTEQMDREKFTRTLAQRNREKFTRTLDCKLKKLQRKENKKHEKSNNQSPNSKKPFITTVKRGMFLDPPPEIAYLIGMKTKEVKKLYAFSSHPRVLSKTSVKGLQLRGFSNLPKTQVKHLMKENGKSIIDNQMDSNFTNIRYEQAQRRALARKRARNQHIGHIASKKFIDISTYAVPDILRDRLIYLSKKQYDVSTQTEDKSASGKTFRIPKSDVQIQVNTSELFDFNTQIKSIVETLVSKTVEDALIDVLEEEELLAMKEQQRSFFEYMSEKTANNLNFEYDISEELGEKIPKLFKHKYVHSIVTSV